MQERFSDKVAVVTGAASGLGLAIAQRYRREGATVVAIDCNKSVLRSLWTEDDRVLALAIDICSEDAVGAAVTSAVKRFGRIDILANVAGIASEMHFLDIPVAEWKRVIDVNLHGTFYMAQAVARQMASQKPQGGVIINMASKNGLTAEVKYAHYNASKAAVVLLSKTMAGDLAEFGIRVNAVAPGYCLTPMAESIDPEAFRDRYAEQLIPMGRLGHVEEIAGTFAFLASEDAGFINGTVIVVDGGHTAIDGRKTHAWDDLAHED